MLKNFSPLLHVFPSIAAYVMYPTTPYHAYHHESLRECAAIGACAVLLLQFIHNISHIKSVIYVVHKPYLLFLVNFKGALERKILKSEKYRHFFKTFSPAAPIGTCTKEKKVQKGSEVTRSNFVKTFLLVYGITFLALLSWTISSSFAQLCASLGRSFWKLSSWTCAGRFVFENSYACSPKNMTINLTLYMQIFTFHKIMFVFCWILSLQWHFCLFVRSNE